MVGIESCVVCVVPFFEDYVDYGLSVWGESSGVGVANYFDGWGGGSLDKGVYLFWMFIV